MAVVELGAHADPARDRIEVDGRPLPRVELKRYVLLHKPRGFLTTRDDPRGRPRVFDLVPELGVRLHSVGRLDFDAEGLLLLTNDGDLTFRLTHPRHGVRRVYHVLVEGRVEPEGARDAGAGGRPGGWSGPRRRGPAARGRGPRSTWLELTLGRGPVPGGQALCRAVGLPGVQRLRRVAFGSLERATTSGTAGAVRADARSRSMPCATWSGSSQRRHSWHQALLAPWRPPSRGAPGPARAEVRGSLGGLPLPTPAGGAQTRRLESDDAGAQQPAPRPEQPTPQPGWWPSPAGNVAASAPALGPSGVEASRRGRSASHARIPADALEVLASEVVPALIRRASVVSRLSSQR